MSRNNDILLKRGVGGGGGVGVGWGGVTYFLIGLITHLHFALW